MKRNQLEYIRDQVQGGDASSPNGNNLVGAINHLLNHYDEADKYGATPSDEDWAEYAEDIKHIVADLSNELADVAGTEGALEDENGNQLADLPTTANGVANTTDLPDRPGGA